MGTAWGRRIQWPLVLFGIGSVLWWRTEGDLRPYAIAQFGPALLLLPAFWFDRIIRRLWPAALARWRRYSRTFDGGIYAALPSVVTR